VTAVVTGRTQCWLQASAGAVCLSIACTSIASVYIVASCDLFSLELYHYFCY